MLLTDIAVEHTVVSKKDGVRQTFLLHPFTDTQRDSLGKFELVRDVSQPGLKDVKRSTFVSFHQLAELYAKGLLEAARVKLLVASVMRPMAAYLRGARPQRRPSRVPG